MNMLTSTRCHSAGSDAAVWILQETCLSPKRHRQEVILLFYTEGHRWGNSLLVRLELCWMIKEAASLGTLLRQVFPPSAALALLLPSLPATRDETGTETREGAAQVQPGIAKQWKSAPLSPHTEWTQPVRNTSTLLQNSKFKKGSISSPVNATQ